MQLRAVTLTTLSVFGCFGFASIAKAQVRPFEPGTERPMFRRFRHPLRAPKNSIEAASTPLKTWNGSFSYAGKTYRYNMVGTAPSGGASTTVAVEIIPVKVVITSRSGVKTTYDPSHVLSNGNTVTANAVASPLFKKISFTSGGVMGTTQYIDAYQRANFWGTVKSHTGYHLLLGGPTVLAKQTLSPSASKGKTGVVFGFNAGLVDINWFDAQLQSLITKLGVQPNTLPIFLTYDVYLTDSGSCCIGGYHSAEGSISAPQAYAHATYVSHAGSFAQDVSALSHEIGEWADDPLVVNTGGNNTPCGILENGDPLENDANFGDFPYKGTNGFTYNLQDLVTLPYFGASPSTSVNGEFTFHGEGLTVCENGS
ncbi:MAG TPA: hypothetical protein VJ731_10550 [Terriglobales bacterium]|nr:hypothetical protein [Terriglobales bacterium]